MSELDPAGIVCRKISNVVVGSLPATASLLGLCTWSGGQRLQLVGVHDDRARRARPHGVRDRAEELAHREVRAR